MGWVLDLRPQGEEGAESEHKLLNRQDSLCYLQVPVEGEAPQSLQGRSLHTLTLLCNCILFCLFWKGFAADKNQKGTTEH